MNKTITPNIMLFGVICFEKSYNFIVMLRAFGIKL